MSLSARSGVTNKGVFTNFVTELHLCMGSGCGKGSSSGSILLLSYKEFVCFPLDILNSNLFFADKIGLVSNAVLS